MIRAGVDEGVVLPEIAPWNGDRLYADESAHVFADGADVRLAHPQAVHRFAVVLFLVVIAGIEMREDRAGLVARRARDLDHVLDPLARLLGGSDVFSGRAELARQVQLR